MAKTRTKSVVEALDDLADRISPAPGKPGAVPKAVANATVHQKVFLRYSRGPGTVSDDGKYVILKFKLYSFNNQPDGDLDVVFESEVDPQDPYLWATPPDEPFDSPSEVPTTTVPVRGYSKSRWRFANGDEIIGVGPTIVNVANFDDDTSMLFVTASYDITSGSGDFEGARGTVSASGASPLPKGTEFGPGTIFHGTAVEFFRVVFASEFEDEGETADRAEAQRPKAAGRRRRSR
jgi:hypothetical protein